eukprot:6268257-Pyramimonas_sp.AAC.1
MSMLTPLVPRRRLNLPLASGGSMSSLLALARGGAGASAGPPDDAAPLPADAAAPIKCAPH